MIPEFLLDVGRGRLENDVRPLLFAFGCWLTMVAAADAACLKDATLLSDQRDLAALRAATEAACLCAGFTGVQGQTRRDYLRCARGVTDATLAAGALRSECRRTALGVARSAVCGSGEVACGRYKPSAKRPLSCRLQPSATCEDQSRFEQDPCRAVTHCVDVIDWTATTCIDVRDDGPFAPGVRVVPFTKPSAVNPVEERVLETVIWYPAPPGSGPVDATYAAVIDAPVDASGGPYPLLVFSHANCSHPLFSTFLLPYLATHGFVVAAPPHPGNTGSDATCIRPNCDPGCEFNCGILGLADSLVERPQDVVHVLDEMLAAAEAPSSPFFGAIDPVRVGVSGFSLGGYSTYVAAAQDPRFKVAMAIAGAAFLLPPSTPGLTVPSLTMIFELDCVLGPEVVNPLIREVYGKASPPKYLVEVKNANHTPMLDACVSFSVCGFPLCGFPGSACDSPLLLTQAEAHDAVRRWVLPFLKVHLTGDTTFLRFLTSPAAPGFALESAAP